MLNCLHFGRDCVMADLGISCCVLMLLRGIRFPQEKRFFVEVTGGADHLVSQKAASRLTADINMLQERLEPCRLFNGRVRLEVGSASDEWSHLRSSASSKHQISRAVLPSCNFRE